MVKAKCIEKVRNKNNIITGYTLQDNTGYTITVEPTQLKAKIASGEVEIVNLKLTPSGRLIDKSIEDTLKGYTVMNTDKVNEEESRGQYNKALILGIAPVLNQKGHVTGVNGDYVVFTDATNIFAGNIIADGTKAEFKGSKELEKVMLYISIRLKFKEVIVSNPCVMANLGEGKDYSISIVSPDIKISFPYKQILLLDKITFVFLSFTLITTVLIFG